MNTVTREVECLYCGGYTTNISMICDWWCMELILDDSGCKLEETRNIALRLAEELHRDIKTS